MFTQNSLVSTLSVVGSLRDQKRRFKSKKLQVNRVKTISLKGISIKSNYNMGTWAWGILLHI